MAGREARPTTKGRMVDSAALAEIRAILGEAPRRADLLIEHLHLLNDRFGRLTPRHLAALAQELNLPQAAVYEVATFYAHFSLADDDAPAPPPTVRVCESVACALAGGEHLREQLATGLGAAARVVAAPCVGACHAAPVAVVGRNQVWRATAEQVSEAVAAGRTEAAEPPSPGLADYRRRGGYGLLAECREGGRGRDAALEDFAAAGLRGMGGAGFPTARKIGFVRQGRAPRAVVLNADEGEPGTFKDRLLLEREPHEVLEGLLLLAWLVEAEDAYVYLRDEYAGVRAVLAREVAALDGSGLAGGVRLHLRRGAGAYVCGEETALLESIEGRRGLPRNRPPFPAQAGLFGRPTLVSNVETAVWTRRILAEGPQAGGWRHYSVSGRVREPGVKLAPVGIALRRLIDEHCGGMAPGHALKAFLPGGASGGIMPAALADLPLDFGSFEPHGGFIGSAAVIVLSEADDLKAVARNAMRFFADESCGQCTPCRLGTERMLEMMAAPRWDEAPMGELARVMADASICGLGQAAPNPAMSLFRHFRGEVA